MTKRKIYIIDAGEEEKGSFCDRKSQYDYENTSDLGRQVAINDAVNRGEQVVDLEGSIFQDTSTGEFARKESTDVDQRFNIWLAQEDNQGQDCPRKYGPAS